MSFDTIDLFARGVRILPDGQVFAEERRMRGDIDGWTVATFHVETDADVHSDTWEMHPSGEELVSVLAGSARVYLRAETGSATEDFVQLRAGSAVVVPRGRWHRIELDEPSDLMSIGPRRGTQLERCTQ
ncbi:cupin domain-containing protein [Nocardia sp. NPDC056100]|uniref:cupin domain-containing protein n=1 Tax=Nocardia sp. NPDC056100 TaxID=3345712 RepID=UPI0035DE3B8D